MTSKAQRCDNVGTTLSDVATKIQPKPNVVTTSCASWDGELIWATNDVYRPYDILINLEAWKLLLKKCGSLKTFLNRISMKSAFVLLLTDLFVFRRNMEKTTCLFFSKWRMLHQHL